MLGANNPDLQDRRQQSLNRWG